MQHATLKQGDTVRLHAVALDVASDFVRVAVGDANYKSSFYVPHSAIASVDVEPQRDLIHELCGPFGRVAAGECGAELFVPASSGLR